VSVRVSPQSSRGSPRSARVWGRGRGGPVVLSCGDRGRVQDARSGIRCSARADSAEPDHRRAYPCCQGEIAKPAGRKSTTPIETTVATTVFAFRPLPSGLNGITEEVGRLVEATLNKLDDPIAMVFVIRSGVAEINFLIAIEAEAFEDVVRAIVSEADGPVDAVALASVAVLPDTDDFLLMTVVEARGNGDRGLRGQLLRRVDDSWGVAEPTYHAKPIPTGEGWLDMEPRRPVKLTMMVPSILWHPAVEA
jgi:hypothetical protein